MKTPRRYAPMGGSFAPVRVAGFRWNGWQTSAVYAINEDEYALEALFLEPQHIDHGYGRVLINEAKKLAAELGAKSLLIQGDPHAESFYRKIGGVRIGERESDSISGRFLPEFKILLADENTA